jgi:uncharacterized protein (TIGR02466 family)
MHTDHYFATPISYTDLPDSQSLNNELLAGIFEWQQQDPDGIVRSNLSEAGAWHSTLNMHLKAPFSALTNHILQTADELFESLGYDPAYQPAIDSMWANINPRHAHNRSHIHPDTLWSGVYYVQAPDNCGRISFSDPRIQSRILTPRYSPQQTLPIHSWPEIYFDAMAGRLILFPAWLVHEVEPNLSALPGVDGYRVSVSFNLYQSPRP